MTAVWSVFAILVFPGFLFLALIGMFAEFVDRKLYARLQNRKGPPWFQPFADFIKLLGKETIIPEDTQTVLFKLLPLFAIAAAAAAIIYIPIWGTQAVFAFPGDSIVVLYLLTVPTLTFFLAGWYSTSFYSVIGAVRTITQLFAYEVPLFMGILAACMLADSWSLSDVSKFYGAHPLLLLFNIIGFAVCLIALVGKLEKVPFDIPDAETEIVAGTFTEYTGRFLAFFRMSLNIEMILGSALMASVFFPFWFNSSPVLGFLIFLVKIFVIIALMALIRTLFARFRIDQMVRFCWKYLAPASIIQLMINLIVKGVFK